MRIQGYIKISKKNSKNIFVYERYVRGSHVEYSHPQRKAG